MINNIVTIADGVQRSTCRQYILTIEKCSTGDLFLYVIMDRPDPGVCKGGCISELAMM